MEPADWIAEAKKHQSALADLIRNYHPRSVTGSRTPMPITAPGPEAVCDAVPCQDPNRGRGPARPCPHIQHRGRWRRPFSGVLGSVGNLVRRPGVNVMLADSGVQGSVRPAGRSAGNGRRVDAARRDH